MIRYDRLWTMMARKKESTYTLRNKYHMSHATIQRMQKNGSVTTYTLDRLCKILDCGLEDIAEYLPDPAEPAAGNMAK